MNQSEQYVVDSILIWVRSGFYSLSDIHSMMQDIMESDADEAMLEEFAKSHMQSKKQEEASWPEETDCERLDKAFDALNEQGIIALQNAGYTMSDGLSDVVEASSEFEAGTMRGYCFFHGQDLKRAVNGEGLMLAFGDFAHTPSGKVAVGEAIKIELENHGFSVVWNGDSEERLNVPNINWQRRAF